MCHLIAGAIVGQDVPTPQARGKLVATDQSLAIWLQPFAAGQIARVHLPGCGISAPPDSGHLG